jgi:hypothetical protein
MSPKARSLTFSMVARVLLVVAVVAIAVASLLLGPGVVAGILVGTLLIGMFGVALVGIVFGRRAQKASQIPISGRR